ncbi:hypothetical protein BDZ91DRAFT_732589 [Kalaharituber pfeilii]|nr:hypothetical protein BDZ91DRAFT_732589 [Kalaharituber pfeilii]
MAWLSASSAVEESTLPRLQLGLAGVGHATRAIWIDQAAGVGSSESSKWSQWSKRVQRYRCVHEAPAAICWGHRSR